MPIAIIVEDGSNVSSANSYVSVADARTYAANRGIELPSDNDALAAMLIQGMDYIESMACEFQGHPTYETQELAWPRKCVSINCQELAEDAIPKQLIGAQVQVAIAINAGVSIFPTIEISPLNNVTEETVGPITTKYADPSKFLGADLSPQLSAVDAMLKPLIETCQQTSMGLRTVRV